MSIGHLLNEPVTVTSMGGTATDGYGDITLAPQSPFTTTGYLEQVLSVEHIDDRDTAVSQWVAYLPAGTAIGRLDQLTFGSQTFQVDGVPANLWNPRTQQVDHIECRLVVIAG